MENEKRVVHLGMGLTTFYHPILRVGETSIISVPSRSNHRILFLGHPVYGTGCLASPIIMLRNALDRTKNK